jgi:hypothetical protein
MEPHIEIYKNKSILINDKGNNEVFVEGSPSSDAQKKVTKIKTSFQKGFLEKLIEKCRKGTISWKLKKEHEELFDNLVNGVTSNYGRSLVGLTVLQLCIKKIEPSLNIRLHKSGSGDFSWKEGIPMRGLDSEFIAPVLRKTNLLKYNKDGVMMTRSFAENYPYSSFYKASIRGSKESWITIVNELEEGNLNADEGLKKIISLLLNKSDDFQKLSAKLVSENKKFCAKKGNLKIIGKKLVTHVNKSEYPARLFEISLHSLFQVLADNKKLCGSLRPLSQMRSANKKFGNIGDIEVIASTDPKSEILEAWDAKFGKPYLFDELGELEDKLVDHKSIQRVGFIVDTAPKSSTELKNKISEIKEIFGIEIEILEFLKFVKELISSSQMNENDFAKQWMTAYVESICQKKRTVAPIDEPSEMWIKELLDILK